MPAVWRLRRSTSRAVDTSQRSYVRFFAPGAPYKLLGVIPCRTHLFGVDLEFINVAHLKKELIEFISAATGGPHKYTGKSMKEVHKGMKITADEFKRTVEHMRGALVKNGVDDAAKTV